MGNACRRPKSVVIENDTPVQKPKPAVRSKGKAVRSPPSDDLGITIGPQLTCIEKDGILPETSVEELKENETSVRIRKSSGFANGLSTATPKNSLVNQNSTVALAIVAAELSEKLINEIAPSSQASQSQEESKLDLSHVLQNFPPIEATVKTTEEKNEVPKLIAISGDKTKEFDETATLEIHERAQKCLQSPKMKDANLVSEEDRKKFATEFAQSLVTDILSEAGPIAQTKLNSAHAPPASETASQSGTISFENSSPSSPKDPTMQIHEICCQTLKNATVEKEKAELFRVEELEKEEARILLQKLIQKSMEEDIQEVEITPRQNGEWPQEIVDQILSIHEEAQSILLQPNSPENSLKNLVPIPSPRNRKPRSVTGPKISVSFADDKEYLNTPAPSSIREYQVEMEEARPSEADQRKRSIMNRRPTGPFLPQLDKMKLGKDNLMHSRTEDGEEDEDEDEDSDEQRKNLTEEQTKAGNVEDLIAKFEESQK